ncbi:MAG: hypothetical protein GXO76_10060, partial [Calditrichaeota bacterium]|nr:hypothetical protein [Calditrichota bacterium]
MPKPFHVHVVSHTHWDREWYLPFQKYRHRLVQMMDSLLDLLEKKPSFKYFVMDGQTVVLEDYLEIRPGNRKRLQRAIENRRLFAGPWYVLPDEFLVSGESLVRNLLRGHRISGEFGHSMQVGYVPDPFGHINQLPQILNGFNIDNFIFTRGIGNEADRLGTEFYWETPDGSRVLAIHQYEGYCHGGSWGYPEIWMPEFPGNPSTDLAVQRLQKTLEVAEARSHTTEVLFNNGCDHLYAQPEIPEIIERVQKQLPTVSIEHSHLEKYIQDLKKSVKDLPRYQGEFRGGKTQFLLSGVLSTRIYLKQANHRAQTLLENEVEPLSVLLSTFFGIDYPGAFLDQAWKLVLLNHPHDSICGCSVDLVHKEMEPRFDQALEIGEWLLFEGMSKAAETLPLGQHSPSRTLLVANTLPWPRRVTVKKIVELPPEFDGKPLKLVSPSGEEIPTIEFWRKRIKGAGPHSIDFLSRIRTFAAQETFVFGLLDSFKDFLVEDSEKPAANLAALQMTLDLPALGFQAVCLKTGEAQTLPESKLASGNTMENEFIRVTVHPNGTFDLLHKPSNRSWNGLNLLEDQEDVGDEYDFSPSANPDSRWVSSSNGTIKILENSPLAARIQVNFDFTVPARIESDRQTRSKEVVSLPVQTIFSIERDSDLVKIETTLRNQAKDHRVRVRFPTGIQAEEVVVDVHFDVIRRSIHLPNGDDWVQKPVPTQNQRNFVAVESPDSGLAVFNQGLPEYEAIPEKNGITLALTLFRSVEWLSRNDLLTRNNDAGPRLFTPDAQCRRKLTFRYAVKPYSGPWQTANLLH